MTESAILTHLLAALAGGGGVYAVLRYVAGWATAFENAVSSDIAVIKHALGIGSAMQALPLPGPRSSVGTASPTASGGGVPPVAPVASAPHA